MGTPVNSTDSLISQKRKTTKIPNYGSNGSAMSVNASIASGYQSLNKNENDLRDHQYDYLWKFICVGNCNVGKSSVLNLYKNHYFNPEDARPTPGLALVETRVNFHRYRIHMQLWDTSGNPRYNSLTASLYRDSMAFLLMFDVTDRASFQAVELWVEHIRTHAANSNPVIYLIGNKVVQVEGQRGPPRCVSEQEGMEIKERLGLEKYLECSTVDSTGAPDRSKVAYLFSDILNEMIMSIDLQIDTQTKTLRSHKTFRSRIRGKYKFDKFEQSPERPEGAGLCDGCCSCLAVFR